MDYFVPNFGMDKEIKNTQASIATVEKFMGRKMTIEDKKKKEEPPVDYPVPNFGVDHDIKVSLNNLKNQEKMHGPMQIPDLVQLDADREPLLAKVGTQKWKGKYPINYPVPNFGVDYDVKDSQSHTQAAEQRLGHSWQPYQEENDDGDMVWQRIPEVWSLNGRTN